MNTSVQILAEVHRKIQDGDLNEAKELLQHLLKSDQSQSEAWNLLGWVQSQQKDFSDAIESIGRAIAIHPTEPSLHRNLGFVYQHAADLDQAVACFERAIQLAPDDANPHNELGVALKAVNENGKAVVHLQKAVQLQPQIPLFRQNLAEVLGKLERFDEALIHYEEAIKIAPHDAGLKNGSGVMLQTAGKQEEAIERFREALAAAPNHPLYENNLASALQSIGEDDEAIMHYENILRALPDSADTHVNIGNFHLARNDLDSAVHHFGRAIAIEPSHFVAHNNFGSTLLDQGKFSEAADQFQQSLQHNSEYAPAYFNLSDLALNNKFHFTDEQIHKMQLLVSKGDLPPESASAMLFAVGNHFDSRENYTEAFRAYAVANDIQKQINETKNIRFDFEKRESLTAQTIEFFNEAYFKSLPSGANDSETPIFIVGMPRSGSTLIEQIIASHPAAVATGELEEAGRLATKILPRRVAGEHSFPLCLQDIEPTILEEISRDYLKYLQQHDAVKPVWKTISRVIDKMWHNYFYLGFLHAMFPKAHFIHSRRDPMDIGLSCFFRRLYAVHWSWDLADIGYFYRLYDRLMQHWRKVLPTSIYEVDYEKLAQHPEEETRKLIDYCNLPWDDRCLEFYENTTAVRTASRIQVREPIYQSSIGRWKNYASQLAPMKDAMRADA